ncbi:MAG TPA: hypothetical protein VH249_19180 [Xanthobacteraceae bacterium]|jgi:hypothetical protein|nr:hypothetical protein [Xanthobacteraceae bacterium]
MKQKRIFVFVAFCAASWAVASPAWPQASAPAPAPTQAPSPEAAEASIHAYGDRDKTCLAWTDKCRSCARGDADAINCSNIGIACQPAEITCTSRPPEKAK